jgi:hypothetical protein
LAKHLKEIEDFWDDYLEWGRCALDPNHQTSFLNAAGRYEYRAGGKIRTCRWCGHEQRKIEKVSVPVPETSVEWRNFG